MQFSELKERKEQIVKGSINERICVNNFTYRRYTFGYFLESVKRLGLEKAELSGCHPHFTTYEQEVFDVRAFAEQIAKAGVKVPVIEPEQNFLPVNIASAADYMRKNSIEQIKFYIDAAAEMGCPKVLVYPGKNPMDLPYEDSFNLAVDSFRQILAHAKEKGVTVLLQNVSENISGMTPDIEHVKGMLEAIGDDELKLSVDVCAVTAGGNTLDEYFEEFGDRIQFVQLSDSDEEDEHFGLGEGDDDISGYLRAMEKYGYEGDISLHLTMEEYADDPEPVYKESLAALEQIWKEA